MQAIIIWSITILATISVVTGVKVGIRRLSEINFMVGQIILMVALFQEDTWCALICCRSCDVWKIVGQKGRNFSVSRYTIPAGCALKRKHQNIPLPWIPAEKEKEA